jgi:hypothetical protein
VNIPFSTSELEWNNSSHQSLHLMASDAINSRRTCRRRSIGKEIVIAVHFPTSLSTQIFPPRSSIALLAEVSPNPTRSGRVEKKSKIRPGSLLQSLG